MFPLMANSAALTPGASVIPESIERGPARVVLRQSLRDQLTLPHGQMKLQLVVHLIVYARTPEAQGKSFPEVHG